MESSPPWKRNLHMLTIVNVEKKENLTEVTVEVPARKLAIEPKYKYSGPEVLQHILKEHTELKEHTPLNWENVNNTCEERRRAIIVFRAPAKAKKAKTTKRTTKKAAKPRTKVDAPPLHAPTDEGT